MKNTDTHIEQHHLPEKSWKKSLHPYMLSCKITPSPELRGLQPLSQTTKQRRQFQGQFCLSSSWACTKGALTFSENRGSSKNLPKPKLFNNNIPLSSSNPSAPKWQPKIKTRNFLLLWSPLFLHWSEQNAMSSLCTNNSQEGAIYTNRRNQALAKQPPRLE